MFRCGYLYERLCVFLVVFDFNSACIRMYSNQDQVDTIQDQPNLSSRLRQDGGHWRPDARPNGGHDTSDGQDIYVYSSDQLSEDPRIRPSISNGHIGTVVHSDVIHMNGVYNGYVTDSHRAIIPSTINANITGVTPVRYLQRYYKVDAKKGLFEETLSNSQINITHRQFAHRTVKSLLVVQIEASVSPAVIVPVEIHLDVNQPTWTNTPDITFTKNTPGKFSSANGPSYAHGRIKEPETNTSGRTDVYLYYDVIPRTLSIGSLVPHVTWTFFTSIHVTKQSAYQGYTDGMELLASGSICSSHVTAWNRLWSNGRIELEGDLHLAKMTTSSLFYILSSLPLGDDPEWPYIGLSPNGLPWGGRGVDYLGHVFWDQATWMFPPILALYPDIASILLAGRKRKVTEARQNARRNGHRGIQYPWEVAFSGVEVSPSSECAHQEIHISGDIVLAILQYVWITGDVSSFGGDDYDDIIIGIADFWMSKTVYNNGTMQYEIKGVMGPDEYHPGINNSVYTNVLAKITFEAAADVTARTSGSNRGRNPDYRYYADHMYIPADTSRQYHPEYDGYKIGTVVKQADVVLLGYPLIYNISRQQRLNDLEIYEKATNPLGPAMTWCMHVVGWLELGESQRAFHNLKKTFGNVASDFMVWTEVVNKMGAPNFLTGQGGFLQAILNGYGGIRVRRDRLDLDIQLPPNVTQIKIYGLDYLGNTLDLIGGASTVNITLTTRNTLGSHLWLFVNEEVVPLTVNSTVTFRRQKAAILKHPDVIH